MQGLALRTALPGVPSSRMQETLCWTAATLSACTKYLVHIRSGGCAVVRSCLFVAARTAGSSSCCCNAACARVVGSLACTLFNNMRRVVTTGTAPTGCGCLTEAPIGQLTKIYKYLPADYSETCHLIIITKDVAATADTQTRPTQASHLIHGVTHTVDDLQTSPALSHMGRF